MTRFDAVVVESVACRPPIRLPRWRRYSVSSSRVSSLRWPARAAGTWDWPRTWRRTLWSTPWRSGLRRGRRGIPAPGSRPWESARRSTASDGTGCWRRSTRSWGGPRGLGRWRWGGGGTGVEPDFDAAFDDEIEDDRLRLIFVACHPVLAVPARVALTLRLVGGLTVPEIARAYLDQEATVAQRIVRAKKTIAAAGVPFEVPVGRGPRRPARCRARGDLPHLQRGLFGHGRFVVGPSRAVRRGAASGPRAGLVGARRAGGARARRTDGVPVVAPACARGVIGRAGAALRPGPTVLGPAAHQPGRGGVGPGGNADVGRGRCWSRSVSPAGGHRVVPRAVVQARGHRLGTAGLALRRAGAARRRHRWWS